MMTRETRSRLEEQARDYKKSGCSFKFWVDELGWEEWMEEYRVDEGEYLTEGDVSAINEVLEEIWDDETVYCIYDLITDSYEEIDGIFFTECDTETKEKIKDIYLYDYEEQGTGFIDRSEARSLVDNAIDLEGICDALNLDNYGYSNEKRYIVKEM